MAKALVFGLDLTANPTSNSAGLVAALPTAPRCTRLNAPLNMAIVAPSTPNIAPKFPPVTKVAVSRLAKKSPKSNAKVTTASVMVAGYPPLAPTSPNAKSAVAQSTVSSVKK